MSEEDNTLFHLMQLLNVGGFVGELQEFVSAIRENREPESSIEKSAHSIAIYEAYINLAETGQPRDVEDLL